MSESNKAIVRRYVDEMGTQGNLALIDELCSVDSVLHGPSHPELRGREARKQHFASLRRAFPDLHYTIEDLIAEEDKVAGRWSAVGTHRGEFWGVPPTNKKVLFSGITTFRIADGVIADEFVQWDALGYMQQIGVVPALTQSVSAVR